MGREVRRVPVDWKHPVIPNPYWEMQMMSRRRRGAPESRLHGPEVTFKPLFENFTGRQADWERELENIRNRTGSDWRFNLQWHLGIYEDDDRDRTCSCHPGELAFKHPLHGWSEDGMEEIDLGVAESEDALYEYAIAEKMTEKPDPADFLPVWDVPEDELGWCLYETVSEGTPVTPVYPTASALVEHLVTYGMDWDQEPMRREAAERLVSMGGSLGSFLVQNGTIYDGAKDLDRIPQTEASGE